MEGPKQSLVLINIDNFKKPLIDKNLVHTWK